MLIKEMDGYFLYNKRYHVLVFVHVYGTNVLIYEILLVYFCNHSVLFWAICLFINEESLCLVYIFLGSAGQKSTPESISSHNTENVAGTVSANLN